MSAHRLKHKLLFDINKVKSEIIIEEIAESLLKESDNILQAQVNLPCPVAGCAYNITAALKPIARILSERRSGVDFFEDHLTKSIDNLVNNVSVTASSI